MVNKVKLTRNHFLAVTVIVSATHCVNTHGQEVIKPSQLSESSNGWQEVVEKFSSRQNAALEGQVSYRKFQFEVNVDDYQDLKELIISSHDFRSSELVDDVNQWLTENISDQREVWDEMLSFKGREASRRRVRNSELDTMQATLNSMATPGLKAIQLPEQITEHVDEEYKTSIEDTYLVLRRAQGDWFHPAHEFDFGLFPFHEVLHYQSENPELLVTAEQAGQIATLKVAGTKEGGTIVYHHFAAEYNYAPLHAYLIDGNEIQNEYICGYVPEYLSISSFRPSVSVASKPSNEAESVTLTLWIVNYWDEVCAEGSEKLLLPPVHLFADYIPRGGSEPVVSYVLPDYLENGDGTTKTIRAVKEIIQNWGQSSSEADFTTDGMVDGSDLLKALERLGVSDTEAP